MQPFRHQPRLASSRDTNFYYSFVFLPKHKRQALEAVYAFARRCDDVVDSQLSLVEAERALAACQADLDRCYERAERPAKEASLPSRIASLTEAVARFHIPRQLFDQLIEGMRMDLVPRRYDTFDDLLVYCHRVASSVGLMTIEILGYRTARARDYALHLGVALQLVNILRDLGEDAARGRIYLPLEDLRRFGVEPESLLQGEFEGDWEGLVQFEVERARASFEQARQSLPREDRRSLRAAEMMAAIYWRILRQIRGAGPRVLRQTIRLSRWTKFRTAASVYLGLEWYKPQREA